MPQNKKKNPEVTIAINSYRNAQMLRLCMSSVQSTMNGNGITYELIVADSATQDDTDNMMRQEFSEVIFLPDKKNIGFGAMVNKCLEKASGKYIFLINADTILEDSTVEKLLEYSKRNKKIGIVAPAQKSFNGSIVPTCFRFYKPMTIVYRRTPLGKTSFGKKHLEKFEMKDYDYKSPKEVDWVIGSAMFIKRETMKNVGIMDSRFFMYMEDVDWCRRFWEQGYSVVYHPHITLYHYYGKGSATKSFWKAVFFNHLTWIHIQSAIKYFVKYFRKLPPRDIQK